MREDVTAGSSERERERLKAGLRIQLHVTEGGVIGVKRRLVQVGVASCEASELVHAYLHLEQRRRAAA